MRSNGSMSWELEFDKDEADGTMITTHGGGTSRKECMQQRIIPDLRSCVPSEMKYLNLGIPVVEFISRRGNFLKA